MYHSGVSCSKCICFTCMHYKHLSIIYYMEMTLRYIQSYHYYYYYYYYY